MPLPLVESLALGLVGVVTEILPLSSGGHAALASLLFGVERSEVVTLATGLGVWLACIVFLRARLAITLKSGAFLVRHPGRRRSALGMQHGEDDVNGERTAGAIAVATIALVAVALGVHGASGAWEREPTLVGASLLLTAVAVASTLWAPDGDRDVPTLWGALLVGAVQGVAVLPGVSRTAVALASLLWLGVRAERAFELCFLIAIPAEVLFVALVRPLAGVCGMPHSAEAIGVTLALIGVVALVGVATLRLLRTVVERRLLPVFALYLVPLAVATTAWAYARP